MPTHRGDAVNSLHVASAVLTAAAIILVAAIVEHVRLRRERQRLTRLAELAAQRHAETNGQTWAWPEWERSQ